MSVTINSSPLKNMSFNGNSVKKWLCNGILVWRKELDILAEYPSTSYWQPSGYYTEFSVSAKQLSMKAMNTGGASSGTNHTATAIMRSFFDISSFNALSVVGNVTIYAGEWNPQYAYIELLNESGSVVKTIYSQTLQCTPGTGYTWNINQNTDVSNLYGNHRIRIRLVPYANWHIILNISKMLLSV